MNSKTIPFFQFKLKRNICIKTTSMLRLVKMTFIFMKEKREGNISIHEMIIRLDTDYQIM